MEKFLIDGKYVELTKSIGINLQNVLKQANLSEGLFLKKNPTLTIDEYFRFMNALGNVINDENVILNIATMGGIESFTPPIFACFVSENGLFCIKRLAKYKKLIGPLSLKIEEINNKVIVEYFVEGKNKMPEFMVLLEFSILINLIRKATNEIISPILIETDFDFNYDKIKQFYNCKIEKGIQNKIEFRKSDLFIPFNTSNLSMISYLEPEMEKRINNLSSDDSITTLVKSMIFKLLPQEDCSIEIVAKKIGYSTRTLQRKLMVEGTTFRTLQTEVRIELGKYWIKNTNMTIDEIAFSLGYNETNSFIRAFSSYTGISITEFKKNVKRENYELQSNKS